MEDARCERSTGKNKLNKISREKNRGGEGGWDRDRGEHAGKRGGRKGIKSKGLPTLSNRV